MLKIEELFIENDAVHADLVRAICLVEEALKFLALHEILSPFKGLLEVYRDVLVTRADSLNDQLDEVCKAELKNCD